MSNEETKVEVHTEEVKGFKKLRRVFTILCSISIVTSIWGIISCIIENNVEVWEHVLLWISLIMVDATLLFIVRSVKNITITVEDKATTEQ